MMMTENDSEIYLSRFERGFFHLSIELCLGLAASVGLILIVKRSFLSHHALARKTTEKTARAQSAQIYEKSGLANRSELAAFFLEDVLNPQGK